MNVLIWGFYDQGNLGDDLMAIIVAELLRALGVNPIIKSANQRFSDLGYEVTDSLYNVSVDAIVLGGGALLKAPGSSSGAIESAVSELARAVLSLRLPVVAISIGSDGVDQLEALSDGRRALVANSWFRGATLRLKRDLSFSLRNSVFLPDVVLLSSYLFSQVLGRPLPSGNVDSPFLINLSRRSVLQFPTCIWLGRGVRRCCFFAHSGAPRAGGELPFPTLPTVQSDDLFAGVEALGRSSAVASSKLHPGVIALSFGRPFYAVAPRPKTKFMIDEYCRANLLSAHPAGLGVQRIEMGADMDWQSSLWRSYKEFLGRALEIV